MSGAGRRRGAAVLLVVAAALWWHRWVPALLVAGFVAWLILHERLEDDGAQGLAGAVRRAWPPGTAVLISLLVAGTVGYWISAGPIVPKVLPIALNVLALSIVSFGDWWTIAARSRGGSGRREHGLAAPVRASTGPVAHSMTS